MVHDNTQASKKVILFSLFQTKRSAHAFHFRKMKLFTEVIK